MPLDDITYGPGPAEAELTFMHRRHEAAGLWRSMPQSLLYLDAWTYNGCFCAMGWLAKLDFDGWSWRRAPMARHPDALYPIWEGYDVEACHVESVLVGAAAYFGISHEEAGRIFGGSAIAHRTCDLPLNRAVTGTHIADAVLAMPVTINSAAAYVEEQQRLRDQMLAGAREVRFSGIVEINVPDDWLNFTVEPPPPPVTRVRLSTPFRVEAQDVAPEPALVAGDRYTRDWPVHAAPDLRFSLGEVRPPATEPPASRRSLVDLFGLRRIRELIGA